MMHSKASKGGSLIVSHDMRSQLAALRTLGSQLIPWDRSCAGGETNSLRRQLQLPLWIQVAVTQTTSHNYSKLTWCCRWSARLLSLQVCCRSTEAAAEKLFQTVTHKRVPERTQCLQQNRSQSGVPFWDHAVEPECGSKLEAFFTSNDDKCKHSKPLRKRKPPLTRFDIMRLCH